MSSRDQKSVHSHGPQTYAPPLLRNRSAAYDSIHVGTKVGVNNCMNKCGQVNHCNEH